MEGVKAAKAPSAAPAPRRGGGAATLRGLALAVDAIPCCYLGALWMLCATNAYLVAARRAFGKDSRATAIGLELLLVALLATLLFRIAFLLPWPVQTRREIGLGVCSEAQGRRSRARVYGYCVLSTALMVGSVGMLMLVLAPKESWPGSVGSMVTDIGCFLYSVTFCAISFPELLIQLRATCAKLKGGMAELY